MWFGKEPECGEVCISPPGGNFLFKPRTCGDWVGGYRVCYSAEEHVDVKT